METTVTLTKEKYDATNVMKWATILTNAIIKTMTKRNKEKTSPDM